MDVLTLTYPATEAGHRRMTVPPSIPSRYDTGSSGLLSR